MIWGGLSGLRWLEVVWVVCGGIGLAGRACWIVSICACSVRLGGMAEVAKQLNELCSLRGCTYLWS